MHPIDRLAPLAFRLNKARTLVFRDGWGDPAGLALLGSPELRARPALTPEIVWELGEERRGLRVTRGQFTTSLAEHLPPEAAVVTCLLVEPGGGTDRVAVLMPAWNDHDPASRMGLAEHLAGHDIASVIFDPPYFGSRRVHSASVQAIATVADFARMGAGAVADARSLIEALSDRFLVGLSGYSMGGNLAALAAALSDRPVAIAPLAASYSPAPVFCDGVLSRAVAWEALQHDGGRERLRSLLDASSVLRISAPPAAETAVFVAARRDGFVSPDLTRALVSHWGGPELRQTDDGHATLLWRRRALLALAVSDAFDRFLKAA